MSKKRFRVSLAAGLLGFLFILSTATGALAADTIKFGAIWGLSGPGSQMQVIMRDAALLAVEWINQKGGLTVGGKQYNLELLVEDNKNTAEGSVSAATKLVHRDQVKFITGLVVPFQIEAVQSVTEPAQVILATAKLSLLQPQNKYTFSSTQGYTVPYPGIYEFLMKHYPNVKNVGFSAHDEPGALATLDMARKMAQAHGLTMYEPVLTQFGTKEYYPAWTKILKDNPDAVDITISFPDCIAANVRHGRELGFKGPIVTVNTGDSTLFMKLIGEEYATDFIFAGIDIKDPNNPAMIKEIIGLWEKKYGAPFNMDALDGWSSIWGLAQAINKAQSLDPNEVVKAWENMDTIETVCGQGTMGGAKVFGINHMVIMPAPVSRLQNGKLDITEWHTPVLP